MTRWYSVPQEIRSIILGYVVLHDRIALYAPVSIEWRDAIEKKTFRRLRIQALIPEPSHACPPIFHSLGRLSDRHRRLVKHIWLNIEHTKHPKFWNNDSNLSAKDRAIGYAVAWLFGALKSWPAQNDLTLEINVYEPMYYTWEWLKGHHHGAPGEQDQDIYLSGTSEPRDLAAPHRQALDFLFHSLDFEMPYATPSVQAVTKFLLPRHCRRQFSPETLSCIAKRLPRLEEISLETWDVLEICRTDHLGRFARNLFLHPDSFRNVKSMTLFQDRNEYFNAVSRHHQIAEYGRHFLPPMPPPYNVPWQRSPLARELAVASLSLESLSLSFMVDAVDFFGQCRENWLWADLRSLTLTSQLLTCDGDSFKIHGLLQTAAQMAKRMPKLERLTIWNGGVDEACAFTYRKHQHNASVTWQAKGGTQLDPAVYSAWETVHPQCFWSIENKDTWPVITSHANAISCLGLEHVVNDLSLREMQLENSIPWRDG
ncbi:hypothetical protein FGADI_8286 [Fusarium gaditjirri]|uniref:DUF6546 domain-containing protein n=1 Tax=Fusarium gaditjirri TaxID=282569 RepID=A0A8H4T328_9HYPO|nr:hypothetical protein FGADI_8286 [Fusarium gaditjirri]